MICPHCQQEHPEGAGFCPTTGQPIQPLVPAVVVAGGAVKHSYPLAIQQATLGTAIGLLLKTLEEAGMRFAVNLAVTLATIVVWVIALGGAAYLGTKVAPAVGWIWAIAWLVAFGFFWRLFVRYMLYLIKCGHIAVLTELVVKGQIGNGSEGMFAYGKRIVTDRFKEVTALFVVDALIKGVVRAFNRTLDFVASLLPVAAIQQLVALVQAVVSAATSYIDETIFSYGLARDVRDPWANAKDGIVYYAQNSKEILKTAVWVVVIDAIFTFAVWLIMLAPAFAISHLMPKTMVLASLVAWVVAILFAASFRAAFLKPLFLIMIMTKFHTTIRNQPINAEWEARLESVSAKFRQIRDHVLGTPAQAKEMPR